MLYLTMKVYEANLLIAVVVISLFLESTGQNIGTYVEKRHSRS